MHVAWMIGEYRRTASDADDDDGSMIVHEHEPGLSWAASSQVRPRSSCDAKVLPSHLDLPRLLQNLRESLRTIHSTSKFCKLRTEWERGEREGEIARAKDTRERGDREKKENENERERNRRNIRNMTQISDNAEKPSG